VVWRARHSNNSERRIDLRDVLALRGRLSEERRTQETAKDQLALKKHSFRDRPTLDMLHQKTLGEGSLCNVSLERA